LNDNAIKFIKALKNEPNLGYDIADILDDKSDLVDIENIKIYKYEDSIDRYLKLFDAQTIAVTDSDWFDEKFLLTLAKISNNYMIFKVFEDYLRKKRLVRSFQESLDASWVSLNLDKKIILCPNL
jgi:hypothetical protein